jgi:Protein of unknown function (DUF791).
MVSSERLTLLAVTQTCFESAMYLFVFMWTPALEAAQAALSTTGPGGAGLAQPSAEQGIMEKDLAGEAPAAAARGLQGEEAPEPQAEAGGEAVPHGLVFAGFMVCVMAGSRCFQLLGRQVRVEGLLRWTFTAACASMAVCALLPTRTALLAAFSVFEVCCGVYFPGQGTLRSRYIPEEVRSSVANLSRLGLNFIVVLVLSNLQAFEQQTVFMLSAVLLAVAALAQFMLESISIEHGGRGGSSEDGQELASGSSAAEETLPTARASLQPGTPRPAWRPGAGLARPAGPGRMRGKKD